MYFRVRIPQACGRPCSKDTKHKGSLHLNQDHSFFRGLLDKFFSSLSPGLCCCAKGAVNLLASWRCYEALNSNFAGSMVQGQGCSCYLLLILMPVPKSARGKRLLQSCTELAMEPSVHLTACSRKDGLSHDSSTQRMVLGVFSPTLVMIMGLWVLGALTRV